jgi:nucleoside-diphosphate-sugar epimerase
VNVLIVGGTRFVGYLLAWRLLARGDRVTLFNRGTIPDPFGDKVAREKGDRTTDALRRVLAARKNGLDAVVDFAAYDGPEVQDVLDALGSSPVHYVFVSTGQVYLVRDPPPPTPTKERDYDGKVMSEPSKGSIDWADWAYGVQKRAAEDVLMRSKGQPWTTFRIPMVNGERDHHRRIESYLVRMLDGAPILLPGGGDHPVRHVYGADVARAIADALQKPEAMGEAFNLAQDESPRLIDVLTMLADLLGAKLNTIDVRREAVTEMGLSLVGVSPFSGRWMSNLDPTKAKASLGFVHTPLREYLGRIVQSWLAHPPSDHPPSDHPPSYQQRALEIECVRPLLSYGRV